MENNWTLDLERKIETQISLPDISIYLKKLKDLNIDQNSIRNFLYGLRSGTTDEIIEDRILEVLDVLEGYCLPQYKVWS